MRVGFWYWLIQLFFLAGLILLLIFIILSGSINNFPIDTFYWVQADTSKIDGAPSISRWTFWGLAEKIDGKSKNDNLAPAYPFSPVDNFQTTVNVPKSFVDNRDTYYYLTRFAFAFFWIALAFIGVTFLLSIFSIFSYSVLKINSWLITLGFLFDAGAVAFETAASVLGKNAFKNDGSSASLGASLFGIAWATVALLFILFFMCWWEFLSASFGKHKARITSQGDLEKQQQQPIPPLPAQTNYNEDPYAQQKQGTLNNESGIKFFKIRRHKEDNESL